MPRDRALATLREAAAVARMVRLRCLDSEPDPTGAHLEDLDRLTAGIGELAEDGAIRLHRGDHEILAAARVLQRELGGCAALLASRRAFRGNWLELASLLAGGYTAAGEPRPMRTGPHFELRA